MKVFSLFSMLALSTVLTTQSFADAKMSQSGGYNGTSSNRTQMDPEGPPVPPNRDIQVHSAHGCLDSGFSFQGEFLWWRTVMDDLEYGLKNNAIIADPNNFPQGQAFSFTVREPDFQFDPGFRFAAGYDFGRDNWDVFLRWTRLYTQASDTVNQGSGNDILIPIRVETISIVQNFGGVSLSPYGKVNWDFHFNSLDFEMGYDYFFSHRFSVRPHMGIKAAWLDMDYRVKYLEALVVSAGDIETMDAKGDSDYWAVGPRFGIDGYLHIGWGFSIYGQISGSLLYGRYDTKYDQSVVSTVPNSPIVVDFDIKQDDFYRLRSNLQMALGVEWAYCYAGDYLFALHLGWETQYWWNQLEMPFFGYFQPDGDLTLSGLTAGARFDF